VPAEQSGVRLEIGHVLFIDIVGYSKLLITEQTELLRKLTATVVETEQFRIAEAERKLVRLPTGDGMALVYAWTGERDRALEQLEIVARIPAGPAGPTYGDLKFNPCWDSLRGDPRFDKIVASLAPKGAKQ
jgi:hypothetical protein